MTTVDTVGKVHRRTERIVLEWSIPRFSTLSSKVDDGYRSPPFKCFDSYWYLRIYPNGWSRHNSEEHISLYLFANEVVPPLTVRVTLSFKHVDGREEGRREGSRTFTSGGYYYGCSSMIQRSEILRRKSEFLPDDVLTVCCTLEFGDRPLTEGPKSITSSVSVQTPLWPINCPCLESLSEDLAKFLGEGSDTDVQFRHDDHSMRAHRAIVCARSPVLSRMLHSDMTEAQTGVVKIPDMEPDIMERFLRYLYTGKLKELTFDVAIGLYEAGDQYEVRALATRCSKFLMEQLTVQNACEVLVVADRHSDGDFVGKVVDYMVDNKVPLAFDRWSEFCDEHPKLANKVLNRVWKAK